MEALQKHLELIQLEADRRKAVAQADFNIAKRDCKNGIYDKWYRYNRKDEGYAYDLGWMEQNKETQVENVTFLEGR